MGTEATGTDADTTTEDTTTASGGTTQEVTAASDAASKQDDPRVTKANQEAANYRKQLRLAEAELEKVKKSTMSEQEKAVAEAEARGKTTATAAASARLARAELRAAAAGRVDKDALDGFLEYVDPAKFLGEDGEPDTKAIEAVISKLAGGQRNTNFDGGARTTASKPTDMNQLIRRQAGIR